MSPRPGTWRRSIFVSSLKRPPSTSVWPSFTRMLVTISLVSSFGTDCVAPSVVVSVSIFASLMLGASSMRIEPSFEMNGRKISLMPESRNSTVCVVAVCVVVEVR